MKREKTGTGKEGVGSGDRQATGRETHKAEAERDTGRRGEAFSRVPVAGTLTRVPPQGAGGLLPQLRK